MTRPTFAAIVTAHRETPFAVMKNLATQTVQPMEVFVGVSEFPLPWVVPSYPFTFVIVDSPNENDYGYRKRNRLLSLVTADFVGFFSCDDSYDGDYIERMLAAVETTGADVAYCQWDGAGLKGGDLCGFQPTESTLGNFIIRTSLINEIGGFPSHEPYHNEGFRDARLIEEVRKRVTKIARVNITMYHRNTPYDKSVRVTKWGKYL